MCRCFFFLKIDGFFIDFEFVNFKVKGYIIFEIDYYINR